MTGLGPGEHTMEWLAEVLCRTLYCPLRPLVYAGFNQRFRKGDGGRGLATNKLAQKRQK